MDGESGSKHPGGLARLAAASCYVGCAPLFPPAWRRAKSFLQHHAAQGSLLVALFVLLIAGAFAKLGVATHLLQNPESARLREGFENTTRWIAPGLAIVWLLFVLAGLVCAAAGSTRGIPLLGWLARRRLCLRAAVAANVLALSCAGLLLGTAWHSNSIARDEIVPAPVYVLVSKLRAEKLIPDVLVKLACYRLALASRGRFGEGSVVVTPLNERSLRMALLHGKFVMVWSHGSGGALSMPGFRAWAGLDVASDPQSTRIFVTGPNGPEPVEVGGGLRLLYLSACYGGSAHESWAAGVAPAEVVTFDRLSGGLEHIGWLWSQAPKRLRDLP